MYRVIATILLLISFLSGNEMNFFGISIGENISQYKKDDFVNKTDDSYGYKYEYIRPSFGKLTRFDVRTSLKGQIIMIMAYANPQGSKSKCNEELSNLYYGFEEKYGKLNKRSTYGTDTYSNTYKEEIQISMMCVNYDRNPFHMQIYSRLLESNALKEKKIYDKIVKDKKIRMKKLNTKYVF